VSPGARLLLAAFAPLAQLVNARLSAALADDSANSVDMGRHRTQEQSEFEVRWGRIQRYWLNILFEAVFLNAWLGLVLLPFVRRSCTEWSRIVSVGLGFPLLFVPYFLGYCPWTFTSTGPSGGALYPWMIVPFYGCSWGMTSFDAWLLKSSGFPLEPLSQPPGPMMSVSGMGGITPTFAIVFGALLGGGVGFFHRALPALRAKINSLRQRMGEGGDKERH
jgi:hypothetical protein